MCAAMLLALLQENPRGGETTGLEGAKRAAGDAVQSADGEFHDSFHYGAALTGLAATKLRDRPVLLIATDEGLAAIQID